MRRVAVRTALPLFLLAVSVLLALAPAASHGKLARPDSRNASTLASALPGHASFSSSPTLEPERVRYD